MPGVPKTYDPSAIVLTWRKIPIVGVMSGTFVNVERSVDAWSMVAGAAGDITYVYNPDESGTVRFTLKAESDTNDLLSAAARDDKLFRSGFGPVMMKNLLGTTLVASPVARLVRLANIDYGDAASGREWGLLCAQLNVHVGGSLV
jgi:hypothetical protein